MAKRGRPTKFKAEFYQKIDEYLGLEVDIETDNGKLVKVKLPTIEGFAAFIDIPRRTVFDWRDTDPEFSHALDRILIEQQKRLINMGLSGEYNSTIAKLILSSNHGMRERSDLTSNDQTIQMTPEDRELANRALADIDD